MIKFELGSYLVILVILIGQIDCSFIRSQRLLSLADKLHLTGLY
jgi:hypothetical protein